jgi:hypothetical protein
MSWKITPGWSPADADAAAYITAVETADNQALENGVKVAIDNFVLGCKQDGIWSAIKASCILAGARTLEGALIPLAGTAPTNVGGLFVSGDYNRKTGLLGDGSTKYLDSNRNNNLSPQNNVHIFAQVTTGATLPNPSHIICAGHDSSGAVVMQLFASNIVARCQTSASSYAVLGSPSTQTSYRIGVSRSASTSFQSSFDGVVSTTQLTSQPPFNGNFLIMRRTTGGSFWNGRIAFYSIGESLNLALLDARVTDLINAFAAAIP